MPVVALTVGVRHEHPAPGDGRHAHQRVAKARLPRRRAVDRQYLDFTALGVENDEPLVDDGRGRSVVTGLVLPGDAAVGSVEGVEVVAPEATAEKNTAVDDGRRRKRVTPGDGHLPASEPSVGSLERGRGLYLGEPPPLLWIDLHGRSSKWLLSNRRGNVTRNSRCRFHPGGGRRPQWQRFGHVRRSRNGTRCAAAAGASASVSSQPQHPPTTGPTTTKYRWPAASSRVGLLPSPAAPPTSRPTSGGNGR